MAHRLARTAGALVAGAVLLVPVPASASGEHHAHGDHGDHGDHGTPAPTADPPPVHTHDHQDDHQHEHGTGTGEGAGHTDHGTEPDEVSPEVRNLVLSGFAGVNAAVVLGAWLMRRTAPDPDPRRRASRAGS